MTTPNPQEQELNTSSSDLSLSPEDYAKRTLWVASRELVERAYKMGEASGKAYAENLAKERVREGRLIELDLLEQALNDGRDLQAYKLQRLEALTQETDK